MAMMLGSGPHRQAEINVTPMIDVLLVLIIIFLVIQPSRSTGLDTLVPQESQGAQSSKPPEDIVVTVLRDEAVKLNDQRVDLADLEGRLKDVLRRGAKPVLFVRTEEDLEFGRIAQVIDIAKGAQIDRVALLPR
jgi:biopolymer transport protein TolR